MIDQPRKVSGETDQLYAIIVQLREKGWRVIRTGRTTHRARLKGTRRWIRFDDIGLRRFAKTVMA